MAIRWLHLSDVHENKREKYARDRMYEKIVKEVAEHRPAPDFVFLTGDLAFSGKEVEYDRLEKEFIAPLKTVLPADCPIFTVPGNHDVDRTRCVRPRLWVTDPDEWRAFQSVEPHGAAKRRDILLPRFQAYIEFDRRVAAWGGVNWLDSEAGAVWWNGDVGGVKVAVVGVNTAWLAQDDDDWGKLSPGRDMLEVALDEARRQKPDLLITLGHHPVEAFSAEGEQADRLRVLERLKQANAVYLHGHLHIGGKERVGDGLRNVLTIQAPSAFQAHDNLRWRNGLMWADVDVSSGELIIEPRLWNEEKAEYKWDNDSGYEAERASGRDGFRLLLPNGPLSGPKLDSVRRLSFPQGWRVIDRATLAEERAHQPAPETMIAFFDGILPNWPLVLARGVQPRVVADRLAGRLRALHGGVPRPMVVLLAGAGGEGKSTAILHAAATLVEDAHQGWTCLQRVAFAAEFPEDLFSRLPEIPGNVWIVVIDDADTVAAAIFAAVKLLASRTDVHLLLAARDADWQLKRLVPGVWQPYANFHIEHLSGLDQRDAERIVAAWHAWGDEAMADLQGFSEVEAARALVFRAHEFAARREQGALLGALLVTRHSEDMRAHVRTMLAGLGRGPIVKEFSVHDVYAMVAVMHAENQLYLSRSVLARALGCDVDELERSVLSVLRREAMLDTSEIYVLIRHRRIADAVCAVLREDGEDIDKYYAFLARAAVRNFRESAQHDPNISDWAYGLAKHFVGKGERFFPIAQRVAKAVCDDDLSNGHYLTAYSSILRDIGQSGVAFQVLKGSGERFRNDRAVLLEWSTVAGRLRDHGLDCWLAGRALADGSHLTAHQCNLVLSRLGGAFRALSVSLREPTFAIAGAAIGKLGLQLHESNPTTRDHFERLLSDGRRDGYSDPDLLEAIRTVRRAVVRGAEHVETEHDPVFFERLLGDPEAYQYSALLRLVKDGARQGRKDGIGAGERA